MKQWFKNLKVSQKPMLISIFFIMPYSLMLYLFITRSISGPLRQQANELLAELEKAHKQLLNASRRAGMAEVATGVLHNVGNVLNSVSVSATLVGDNLRLSRLPGLAKAAALMREHAADLGAFFASDPKGRQLPGYLSPLAGKLAEEQEAVLREVDSVRPGRDAMFTLEFPISSDKQLAA
jgi:hypothetical protein